MKKSFQMEYLILEHIMTPLEDTVKKENLCQHFFFLGAIVKITAWPQRWPESLFQSPTPLLFKIFESASGSSNFTNLRIRLLFRLRLQSSINRHLPMFLLQKLPHRLLLLPKSKVTPDPVLPEILTPGPKQKRRSLPESTPGAPDPVPPLLGRTWSRGTCWAAIWLSHRPEPSCHAQTRRHGGELWWVYLPKPSSKPPQIETMLKHHVALQFPNHRPLHGLYGQNRHHEVVNRGALRLCRGAWHSYLTKIPWNSHQG